MEKVNWVIPIPTNLGRMLTRSAQPELGFISKIMVPDGAICRIVFRAKTGSIENFKGPLTIDIGNGIPFAGIEQIGALNPGGLPDQIVLVFVTVSPHQSVMDLQTQKPVQFP
jgi:hypothetical protein